MAASEAGEAGRERAASPAGGGVGGAGAPEDLADGPAAARGGATPDGARDGGAPRGVSRVRVLIAGRVQGVGFRESTRQLAERLRVGGWVRNLGDGRVEAVFEGPAAEVAQIVAWCRRGPPGARVSELDVLPEAPAGESSFRILRTEYGAR
jgi:acylphosphatase